MNPDQAINDLVLGSYIGEICPNCKEEFKSVQDLRNKDPKWIGKLPNGEENPEGRICCKNCFPEYEKKVVSSE